MKHAIAFIISLSLEIGLWGAMSHAKASEPILRLECMSDHGLRGRVTLEVWRSGPPDPDDYAENEHEKYKRELGEFQVLSACGKTFATREACEIASAAVKKRKPYLGSDGPSPHQNVRAACVGPKVSLHCFVLFGERSDITAWAGAGGEYTRRLGPCGQTMTRAACEAAASAVNEFRPEVEGAQWKLFGAMCAEAPPVMQM